MVPFGAGGPVDIIARGLADKLSTTLNQTFLVENHPGAGGNIGTATVAHAAPDGYTLAMVLGTTLTVNPSLYPEMSFDAAKDLRVLCIATASGNMLVVHPSLPVKSLADFVNYAKAATARREPLLYATGGIGTPGQLVMEYFRLTAGFDAKPVAYRGNAPMVTDLLAGHVKLGFVATAGMMQYVEAGQLRGLAVSAAKRSPLAPDVPTVAESGYPGFSVETYMVMVAPAATPQPVVGVLERALQLALAAPDLEKRLGAMDTRPVAIVGAAAQARIEADRKLWTKVVKTSHMKVF